MASLPTLVEKALIDAGFDLISNGGDGWIRARISGGFSGEVYLRTGTAGTILAVHGHGMAQRIGLAPALEKRVGMESVGRAGTAAELHRALRLLHALESHAAVRLSKELEARLAQIPATERTAEVRKRIGQDVFREALAEFWDDRCALSGMALPAELLRVSHAKPWADASDAERLDPFNGLLLAVQFDALFDNGLIAFGEDGDLLVSSSLSVEVRKFTGLEVGMRLRFVLPGHVGYLRYHRKEIARL